MVSDTFKDRFKTNSLLLKNRFFFNAGYSDERED